MNVEKQTKQQQQPQNSQAQQQKAKAKANKVNHFAKFFNSLDEANATYVLGYN